MGGTIYDFDCERIDGTVASLREYEGRVLLVVNTASRCGLTPQYKGLQQLHELYEGRGLTVLGFPCNQFLSQEPGSSEEISSFCSLNYGVQFPMFSKIDVNGKNTAPLFEWLKAKAPGALGSKRIKWNFTKFLVARDGATVTRFAPKTDPAAIAADIQALL